MRIRTRFLRVGLIAGYISSVCFWPLGAYAAAPVMQAPPSFSILELKMTGDEFIVLQNNTTSPIVDLASYWLYAFNKTDPSINGASSSGQQLPVGGLDPGQTLLLSDKGRATCGAAMSGSLSLSLGDANGFLQLTKQTVTNGMLTSTPIDTVSWGTDTSTKPKATVGTIATVPSNSKDPNGMYYRSASAANGWQLADADPANLCQLSVVNGTGQDTTAITTGLLAASGEPPATIVSLAANSDGQATPTLPASDVGLSAPQVTELLPNPTGTGNDGTDEFIELYNSNAAPFDLTGFVLQTGETTKHNYVFPAGTIIPPQSFRSFNAAETGLSLSNTSGMADLLDPFGSLISKSDVYGTAKDGQSWTLAKGQWYWTAQPTPGSANVIKQAAVTGKKAKVTSAAHKASTGVKGASTTTAAASSNHTKEETTAPIHPLVLAVIVVLAVGYGVYEYRHDLANRIYQFRKNRAARRKNRHAVAR
jgi:hypothetical protein